MYLMNGITEDILFVLVVGRKEKYGSVLDARVLFKGFLSLHIFALALSPPLVEDVLV